MLLRLLVFVFKVGMNCLYGVLKLLPLQQKVVLISSHYTTTSLDFRLLKKEIKMQHPGVRVVICNHRFDNLTFGVKPVVLIRHFGRMLKEMYHLATSQGCIVDSYVITVSILRHRDSLTVIQLWHALGAIKQFGHLSVGKPGGTSQRVAKAMHMHRGYDYVIAGSKAMTPVYEKAFQVPAKRIKPYGLPRVDYLKDKAIQKANRDAIFKKYPSLQDKQVIIYMPTFRPYPAEPPAELIDSLHDNQVLVIKPHLHDGIDYSDRPNVIVDRQVAGLKWLAAADALITDYSAILFEAAVCHVPLYFYPYDEARYREAVGFAVDYPALLPGPVMTNPAELIEAIAKKRYTKKDTNEFRRHYTTASSRTTSAQRISKLLTID